MKPFRIAALVYAVFCAISVLLIFASAGHWFGIEPDPLSGLYAVLLAMPWSLVIPGLNDGDSVSRSMALMLVGMVLNIALLLGVGWALRRRHA